MKYKMKIKPVLEESKLVSGFLESIFPAFDLKKMISKIDDIESEIRLSRVREREWGREERERFGALNGKEGFDFELKWMSAVDWILKALLSSDF